MSDLAHQRLLAFEAGRRQGFKDQAAVAEYAERAASWIASKPDPAFAAEVLRAALGMSNALSDLLTTAEVVYTFASKTPAPQATPEPPKSSTVTKRRFKRV